MRFFFDQDRIPALVVFLRAAPIAITHGLFDFGAVRPARALPDVEDFRKFMGRDISP